MLGTEKLCTIVQQHFAKAFGRSESNLQLLPTTQLDTEKVGPVRLSSSPTISMFLSIAYFHVSHSSQQQQQQQQQSQEQQPTFSDQLTLSFFTSQTSRQSQQTQQQQNEVPLVVRLGVLTIFPVIEAMRSIKDVNYVKLCQQIMNTMLQMLSSLPAMSLRNEPADCLDAYQRFIFEMIRERNFQIETADDYKVSDFKNERVNEI
jgi:hypothetical protein